MKVKTLQSLHPALKPHVHGYVVWQSSSPQEEQVFLPSHFIGIGFTLQGELYVKDNDQFVLAPRFGIRDIYRKASSIRTTGHFRNISVRFAPGSVGMFLKTPMNHIVDERILSLDNIFSSTELESFAERLNEAKTDGQLIGLLDNFLLGKLSDNSAEKVKHAISCIVKTQGTCRVSDISGQLGCSERSVLRMFNQFVGIGPNEYIKLVRFREIVRQMRSPDAGKHLGLALDAGYYDQSHFIKEFKNFTTYTPLAFSAMLKREVVSDFYNV